MKSKIVECTPFKWGAPLLIDFLPFDFDEEGKAAYIKDLSAARPGLTEDELERACALEVVGRNIHVAAMSLITKCYTVNYHESDIEERIQYIKEDVSHLIRLGQTVDYKEEELVDKAKESILHDLIHADLAEKWNVKVADDHLFFFLKLIYGGKFGFDVSKYLNNPKEFEKTKKIVVAFEVAKKIRKAFKLKLKIPKFEKYAEYITNFYSYEDPESGEGSGGKKKVYN